MGRRRRGAVVAPEMLLLPVVVPVVMMIDVVVEVHCQLLCPPPKYGLGRRNISVSEYTTISKIIISK